MTVVFTRALASYDIASHGLGPAEVMFAAGDQPGGKAALRAPIADAMRFMMKLGAPLEFLERASDAYSAEFARNNMRGWLNSTPRHTHLFDLGWHIGAAVRHLQIAPWGPATGHVRRILPDAIGVCRQLDWLDDFGRELQQITVQAIGSTPVPIDRHLSKMIGQVRDRIEVFSA